VNFIEKLIQYFDFGLGYIGFIAFYTIGMPVGSHAVAPVKATMQLSILH